MTTTQPAPHRALRKDATENRRRLIDAAKGVFAEHGLEAGVEEVAHVAGVGIGTLYRRFPTKDALIAELVRELLEDVVRLAHEAQDLGAGRGLEWFLYGIGETQAANRGCLARVWSDDTSNALRDEYRGLMLRLLADAREHGTVRDDATLTDIDLLFWSLRGVLEATGDASGPAWRRQVAVSVAGLRPSPEALAQPPVPDALVAAVRVAALKH
ncbi:TetR family transcriptional regulator [Frondihabitans sp. PAMC 28766]|uniref:TetR/AcrR family transcriptional regulator n=1 Tax=Frondihabitans sp. PAMC 28766 TaxID=1795630 RepID=UPI00078D66EB|nr:TetR/AcrR family transcriptional regulator [Frondihabitans sp. PAMC 28766]AMM21463.1 TetR family transcriptional regulator [Frondihabitans sp. PAMC 28766]